MTNKSNNPPPPTTAKFTFGSFVEHKLFGFRGVVFDIDPTFSNTQEWYESIPEHLRPPKNQPFYSLLAQNDDESHYVAYVSEQNLRNIPWDNSFSHPELYNLFQYYRNGRNGRFIPKYKPN